MQAVISGQAGVALLLDGENVFSLQVDKVEELVRRRHQEIPYLFGDARDLLYLEDVDIPVVSRELEDATTKAEALHIALILLDSVLPSEIRQDAAEELSELLTNEKVLKHVESVLFSHPLPADGDLHGALCCCTNRSESVRQLLLRLQSSQEIVRALWHAWEQIPTRVFGSERLREYALAAVVREGLFRDVVALRTSRGRIKDFIQEVLSRKNLTPIENLGDILEYWLEQRGGDLLRLAPWSAGGKASAGLNLLCLCDGVPYPPKGDKSRTFHQVRALAAKHRIHLLTLSHDGIPDLTLLEAVCERVEVFSVSKLGAYGRAALRALQSSTMTRAFVESDALGKRLRELARRERFDAMVVYRSAMAPYADLYPNVPALLDMVDIDSIRWAQYTRFAPLPLRPVYALEARRLRLHEAALARRFQCIVFATGSETRLYKSIAPQACAETVLSGVDFDFFQPFDLPKAAMPTLVFAGQMDYFANVDGVVNFAHQVFPRLRRRYPDIELLLVGRSPVPAVRDLEKLPGVRVTGAVGDERPFLARAWVFVAPLRIAQGVESKVLDAMASNLPVACSERVLAGLSDGGFRSGRDLIAASSDDEMAFAISDLIERPRVREQLANSARQRLLATYDWGANLEHFEEILLSLVPGHSERQGMTYSLESQARGA